MADPFTLLAAGSQLLNIGSAVWNLISADKSTKEAEAMRNFGLEEAARSADQEAANVSTAIGITEENINLFGDQIEDIEYQETLDLADYNRQADFALGRLSASQGLSGVKSLGGSARLITQQNMDTINRDLEAISYNAAQELNAKEAELTTAELSLAGYEKQLEYWQQTALNLRGQITAQDFSAPGEGGDTPPVDNTEAFPTVEEEPLQITPEARDDYLENSEAMGDTRPEDERLREGFERWGVDVPEIIDQVEANSTATAQEMEAEATEINTRDEIRAALDAGETLDSSKYSMEDIMAVIDERNAASRVEEQEKAIDIAKDAGLSEDELAKIQRDFDRLNAGGTSDEEQLTNALQQSGADTTRTITVNRTDGVVSNESEIRQSVQQQLIDEGLLNPDTGSENLNYFQRRKLARRRAELMAEAQGTTVAEQTASDHDAAIDAALAHGATGVAAIERDLNAIAASGVTSEEQLLLALQQSGADTGIPAQTETDLLDAANNTEEAVDNYFEEEGWLLI
jgi:hypothetical protein